MQIAIIGAGNVGRALGRGFARAGHGLIYGVRDPKAEKYAEPPVPGAAVMSVKAAGAAGDVVILATPWAGTQSAVEALGDLGGRPLLDATNPIGPGFALTLGHTDSGGEQVARWATGARVVKVFNTIGADNMTAPDYGAQRAFMPVSGDDPAACAVAVELAEGLGFEALHIGGLATARRTEPLAMLWIGLAMGQKDRTIAFGLLRR